MPGMLHPAIEIIRSSTNAIERIIQLLGRLNINDIAEHSALSKTNPSGGLSFITTVVATDDISLMYEMSAGEHTDEFGYSILLEISPDLLKTLANAPAEVDDDSEDNEDGDVESIDVNLYWRINPEKPSSARGRLCVESNDYENLAARWLRSVLNVNHRSFAGVQMSITSEERLFELIEQLLTAIGPYIRQVQGKQSA